MARPTISLCMIVKNEERFLRQCLESIRPVIDELIVVDTGSQDNTVRIAESCGATVFHHHWQNSFSEARNFSLSKATGDWIFILDGDEELFQEDIPLIRKAVNNHDIDGYLILNINPMPDGGVSKHKNIRLYRNGKVHYEGIVHNEPIIYGNVCDSAIRVLHHGYNLSPEEMERKFKRSEVLLKKQVKEDPANTYAWANLIRNYRLQKKYDAIIADGKSLLERSGIPLFDRQMITNDLMYACFVTDRFDRAVTLGEQGLAENPFHPDLLFILGGVMVRTKQIKKALNYFFRFLEVLNSGKEMPGLEGLLMDSYGFQGQAWNNIGSCFMDLGDLEKAIDSYKNAIKFEDTNIVFYKNLASLYLRTEKHELALRVLEAAMTRGISDEVTERFIGELRLQAGTDELG